MIRLVQLLTSKENRTGKRYKQIDIAHETGLSPTYISGLITGRVDPGTMKVATARILCQWLECGMDDLFEFRSDDTPEQRSA